MSDMRRDFRDRDDLVAYLREQFPEAAERSAHVSPFIGGRVMAEKRLRVSKFGVEYAQTRGHFTGNVTRLSPYIRHGVLSLAEVRDMALSQVSRLEDVEKFVNELAWRDYWQRVYAQMGDKIWQDLEPYKTGFSASDYADELPYDIRHGDTGVRFIDDLCKELFEQGYLHNHGRMWLSAYIVHWRRVKWQAGARWFLEHLVDGDPASNNLSWQWVASTYSHKPYFYNWDNVIRFTGKKYAALNFRLLGNEAFVGTYEQIAKRLFPNADIETHETHQRKHAPKPFSPNKKKGRRNDR